MADVEHVLVPDRGEPFARMERVNLVKGPNGAVVGLERDPLGSHYVVSWSSTERDGEKLLNVGVAPRP